MDHACKYGSFGSKRADLPLTEIAAQSRYYECFECKSEWSLKEVRSGRYSNQRKKETDLSKMWVQKR